MESKSDESPLIVIVGETASGKSALGLDIAKLFNGEIICADSRTIYKGMDIGTAKPTTADRQDIRHHLLDIVEPGDYFSAADFKQAAKAAINDITNRGKLPIMVGGTGLYIDSVLFDYQFAAKADLKQRKILESLSTEELQSRVRALGLLEGDINYKNRRHLIRALENGGVKTQHKPLRPHTLVIGLQLPRDTLKRRIEERVETMVNAGFIEEVRRVGERYGWESEALTGIGYRAFRQYVQGETTLEEAKKNFVRGDLLLAKRQRTWFKRNKSIHWIGGTRQAFTLVADFLNKVS